MARSVRVGDFQAMLAAPHFGDAAEPNEDGGTRIETVEEASSDQSRARDSVTLRADDQAARILAEKHASGLHAGLMIGGCPSCADDQAESTVEDAIASLGQDDPAGDGPREYDVVDGEVRDWRRPDTTPDRGDVTTVHTITDDEPRFSGAGDGQQATMFLVPTDAAFNGKAYRDAPELANIAERLIGEHGFLGELVNCDVRWYWKRKTGVSKGRVKIGFMKRASDLLGHFSGADFIGWLSATTARDGKFTDTQIEAAVFHQLCHIGSDDSGNWIFAPHDFEGFAAEVRVFGTWTSDLKLGGNAFVAAHQMGLFSDEDEDEVAEDDGAGVLIHADGTPLTDDEIEAMERHELNDEEDDDDPLVDHDL
jgi:hypothetical protein